MRTIKPGPPRRMRCNGVRRLRDARTDRGCHGMVVGKGGRLCTLRSSHILLSLIWTARGHGSVANALPRLIRRMIEQRSDVVNEKWIEHFGDFLFVREIQRAIEWNPVHACQPRNPTLCRETYQTPLRCIGPILTTCRVFSLFKIPSRRPRVIPATFKSFVPLIM